MIIQITCGKKEQYLVLDINKKSIYDDDMIMKVIKSYCNNDIISYTNLFDMNDVALKTYLKFFKDYIRINKRFISIPKHKIEHWFYLIDSFLKDNDYKKLYFIIKDKIPLVLKEPQVIDYLKNKIFKELE